jgi:uncharacterized protein (TIGR03437 family)
MKTTLKKKSAAAGSAVRLPALILALAAASGLSAAPTITAIGNAASNRFFAYPVAQGSIFIIKGSGLGPASLAVASTPFQDTTLSGTSVSVALGSATVKALMYYTSDGQIAALLPSNTPTNQGPGMFTVTYNGETSNAFTHGVGPSAPGIFTIDSSGQGPGIVTYADYSLVSAAKSDSCGGPNTTCGAANPGDTLILWATGLGPVNGDDASGAGLGLNMPNLPVILWLGGVEASISYQGRSGCCIGEDQIVFTVPNNVPTGCAVPLVLQINGAISNTVFMPVANGSRDCTPVNPALASVNVEQAVTAGPITFAQIGLAKNLNPNGPGYVDNLNTTFAKITSYTPGSQPFFLSWVDDQPVGTCVVYNNLKGGGNTPNGTNFSRLDAGESITVKGPNGSQTLPVGLGGGHPPIDTDGSFLVPGPYTVSGTGGADIGPFSAAITFPSLPKLASPANNASVPRADGMTITWTGGDPSGNLQLVVTSAIDQTSNFAIQAICNAPTGPGTFTIPPYVMLALPSGPYAGFTIAPITAEVPFTATGLGVGILQTQIDGAGYGFGAGTGGFKLQ